MLNDILAEDNKAFESDDYKFNPPKPVPLPQRKGRDQIPEGSELRRNVVHVFGVDFFSEKEILDFFIEFNPVKVEWINDSSCNVVFPNDENCSNALFAKTTQMEENDHELDWRKGLDIPKDGKNFSFFVRYATVNGPGVRKKIQKGKPNPGTKTYKRGQNLTLMDKKRLFNKRVVSNNIEVMNQLPGEEVGYNYQFAQQNHQAMPDYSQITPGAQFGGNDNNQI